MLGTKSLKIIWDYYLGFLFLIILFIFGFILLHVCSLFSEPGTSEYFFIQLESIGKGHQGE